MTTATLNRTDCELCRETPPASDLRTVVFEDAELVLLVCLPCIDKQDLADWAGWPE